MAALALLLYAGCGRQANSLGSIKSDYRKEIHPDQWADVNNDGGRWGGAITAAKFLENFVDKKIPWAHLDIAGPAVANNLTDYNKDYMTGFGVRLMIEYLLSMDVPGKI